jgi:hypothetical protein
MLDKQKEDPQLPRENDYIMHPCGRLGADTCVEQLGGAYIGQFGDITLAKLAVRVDMERKQQNRKMWYRKADGTLELALGFDGL